MSLALLSTRVFTGDPERPWAEAIGITDNLIVAVGSNQTVKDVLGSGKIEIYELPGRLVTPGLVDAHCHFSHLGLSLLRIDLSDQPSLADCIRLVARKASTAAVGEWLIGQGWNQFKWRDPKEPDRQDLDRAAPDHPAIMYRACGHSAWVNTKALHLAGITRDTPDPPGARIERDPKTGEPTGLLREAGGLVERVMPKPGPEDWQAAILASQQAAFRFGLTQVHTFESLSRWEAMKSLEDEGGLKIRVHHSIQAGDLNRPIPDAFRTGYGSERLWVGHVKLFADGSLGSGTALLHEPYSDDAELGGIAVTPVDDMAESIKQAYGHGFDIAVHAIGDRATSNCLAAIAAGREGIPEAASQRDRIEHVQLIRKEDIHRFKQLGIVASVQPVFLHTDWHVAQQRWGHARCKAGGYAWRTLLDAGIPAQFGSDAPVESINPIYGLHAAVTRKTPSGKPEGGWFPAQRLTLAESISGFTRVAAWTARKENRLGALKEGRLADITVFERDLFEAPSTDWLGIEVEMTIIGGDVVYCKKGDRRQ